MPKKGGNKVDLSKINKKGMQLIEENENLFKRFAEIMGTNKDQ